MRRLIGPLFAALLAAGCGGGSGGDAPATAAGSPLLTPQHGNAGDAWGLDTCAGCHALSGLHEGPDAARLRPLAADKGYAACMGCHGDNGTGQARPCLICHNPTDLPRSPIGDGEHGHGFGAALADPACAVCHLAADMDGSLESATDLTALPDATGRLAAYRSTSDFCLRCHNRDHWQPGFEFPGLPWDDPRVAMEDFHHYIDSHGEPPGSGSRTYAGLRPGYRYASEVACSDCHTLHGTDNPALLIGRSDQGASLLEAALRDRPYDVDASGGNYAQLCVLCHAMAVPLEQGEVDTGNGLAGVHAVAGDCRPCHSHGEAVQAGL